MPIPETKNEQARDKTVADTFPASDAPANSGITGAEGAQQDGTESQPTGQPVSDRSDVETAHHHPSDPQVSTPGTQKDMGRQKA